MTKIEKQDIDNIKLVVKETKLKNISKIRIKKNNYEIEITSEDFVSSKSNSQSLERIPENKESNEIKEVILATSITTAGQTTAHYLLNNIKKLDIKVSRLARGVPAGGELDYLDEATLGQALNERTLVFDRINYE